MPIGTILTIKLVVIIDPQVGGVALRVELITIKLVVIIDPQVGGVALRVELINLLSCEKEVLIENQLV